VVVEEAMIRSVSNSSLFAVNALGFFSALTLLVGNQACYKKISSQQRFSFERNGG